MQSVNVDLSGKTYFITGASSGIGASTAIALGRLKANVVLAARRRGLSTEVADQVIAAGGQALVLVTDVADESSVRDGVQSAVAHFGRLDGAFNNASTLGVGAPLHESQSSDVEAVMRTNVMGTYFCMKHQIAAMLQTGGGAIVNNLSVAAQVGFPGISAYAASKHAVLGLTRTAALEYFKHGIRINAVSPGPIVTPMSMAGFGGLENLQAAMKDSPAGRPGLPEEVAAAVLFLLSSGASLISGHALTVDGGYTVE